MINKNGLRIKEVQEILGVSTFVINGMIKRKTLKVNSKKPILINKKEVDEILERRKIKKANWINVGNID